MKKKDLAERLAQTAKVPPALAADELDSAIHSVVKSMRKHGPSRPNALQRLILEGNCALDPKGQRASS